MFHMLDFGRDGHAVLVAAVAELARYRSVRRLTAWIAQHRSIRHYACGPRPDPSMWSNYAVTAFRHFSISLRCAHRLIATSDSDSIATTH